MSKEFFDEIIECLKIEQEKKQTASVSPDVLNEFFSEIEPTPGMRTAIPPQKPKVTHTKPVQPAVNLPDNNISTMDLEQLCAYTQNCQLCRLCEQRTRVVFGEGNPQAELMFIGEGPGVEEDQQGRPFVGVAGQLLDKMITAMQYSRESVYIANIVKCRPPNNRAPQPDEAASCLPYLKRQIELIAPKAIVLLGAIPLLHLTGQTGITRLRGQWMEYNGIKVMPTYHPAYLLRKEEAKRDVWADLQQVMKLFGKTRPSAK